MSRAIPPERLQADPFLDRQLIHGKLGSIIPYCLVPLHDQKLGPVLEIFKKNLELQIKSNASALNTVNDQITSQRSGYLGRGGYLVGALITFCLVQITAQIFNS